MCGRGTCGGVEVGDGGGRQVGVWGEEEGALQFGRGDNGVLEGFGDALGEEEVALGEMGEDLFEDFREVDGACCC